MIFLLQLQVIFVIIPLTKLLALYTRRIPYYMKLVTYSYKSAVSCGLLTDSGIIDIPTAKTIENPPKTILEILENGPDFLKSLEQLTKPQKHLSPIKFPSSDVKLLAPIPRPPK